VVHLIIKIVTLYWAFLFFLFISKFNQMLSFTYWVNSLAFWWNISNIIVILTTFFQWLNVLKNWNFIKLFIKLISALFQWIKKSDKIDLFEKRCRWFQLFSIDFQLFYFLTRIIPDMTDYSEYYIVTRNYVQSNLL
jgi:hypothetical protein